MRFSTSELDGTQRRVSKQLAKRLIASGCYRWLGKLVSAIPLIERPRAVRTFSGMRYVPPGKMPPAEVENCFFQSPESDQWKLDHRNVERDLQIAASARARQLTRDLEMAFAAGDSCAQSAAFPIGDSPLLSAAVSA